MHPFQARNLRERLVPFVVPLLLAGALIAAGAIPVSTVRAVTAAGIGLTALAAAFAVPWRKLPASVQVLPPLLALVAIALAVGGSNEPGVSPLAVLVISPVLWLALYHEPSHVWVGVAGAGLAVAAGSALAELPTKTSAAAAAVTIASCAVLGLMTIRILQAERRTGSDAAAARDHHRLVLDHLPGIVIGHVDTDMRWVAVEGAGLRHARDDVEGKAFDEVAPPGSGEELRAAFATALTGESSRVEHRSSEGDLLYEMQVRPLRDSTGEIIGALSVGRDITVERRAAARLLNSERDHRLLTESSRDMISRHDLDGRFLYASTAARDLIGYEPHEVQGRLDTDFAEPEDLPVIQRARTRLMALGFAACEFRMRHQDGGTVWIEQRGRVVRDDHGAPVELHFTARDVTGRRESERQLAHLATHDDLTGLWSRRRFNEALREELARAHRRGADAVMLLIDLDGFKPVNDTYGHETGDRLLTAVADAIRSRMREGDCGGRLGGDEFAVLLRGTAPEQADHVAREYAEAIAATAVEAAGETIHPRASVGAAVVSAEAMDERAVLAEADSAMYQQKAARKSPPAA